MVISWSERSALELPLVDDPCHCHIEDRPEIFPTDGDAAAFRSDLE
jgi:hypothetical protein